ncbi:uncharacterized protein [Euphorbia lathyris]|uniref:uncharacterized protein n=1 Tax=Euphorbia lathyris TaxID=212925 RepID=UPI0033136365
MVERALNIVSSSASSSSLKDTDRHRIDSGRPIRFVYFDENDNLRLDSEAIDVLQRIKGPVAVVSIFGPARQGKSFIVNQILGKSSGFPISSTHQSCTKGLWMWSEPLKRIALDGTEYDLLLFDSGGINAYDHTGMHSAKMFTLAVLLSSMFIYNQVGLIDEAALDRLSLVTEMTKHIHVRASERNDSISEFEYFIPVFIWLLRDFYLDLVEDNTRITPHDYLKHALRPMLDGGKDIATKNQICESIRAIFPNQECFTLVRPLNNETELQHLDQVSLDKFRPEFQSGLDVFVKFVYERTRPKQVGGSAVTGPLLATITKFFLDVLNESSIPTISSSWQIRARDAFMEADSHCSEVIKSMEMKLQEACQVANARLEHVAEVLESLLSEYEASVHGPTKWQKLSLFLQKSLQGPILLHAKKLIDQFSSEKSSLLSKCCSNEDKIELLGKQLEASHKLQSEYQNRYDDAIQDFKKVSDQFKSRTIDLEQKNRIIEERCSSSLEMLDSAKQDSLLWERKYEQVNAETAVRRFGVCEETAKIAATAESSQLVLQEAYEWKEKYDTIVNESKAALEKAAEQARHKEEALIAKFTDSSAEKDKEIKEMATRIEDSERRLTSLTSDLKAVELKIEHYDLESSGLKLQIKELAEKHEFVKASNQSMEKEIKMLEEARIRLEEKYLSELKRFEEAQERFKVSDEEAKINKNIETTQPEGFSAQTVIAETMETGKEDLAGEADRSAASVDDAMLKIALLEATVRDKDQEIELLKKKCEQFLSFTPMLDAARTDANRMEESPSFQLESTQETKVEDSERRLTSLTSDLKAAESKIENYDLESSALKLQIKELAEKHEFVKASNQSMEKEIKMLEEARIRQEEKYLSELKKFEEAQERFKVSDEEPKINKNIETALPEGFSAQTVNAESMETGKEDLAGGADRSAASLDDAMSKIALLEAAVRDKDQEIELLKKNCEQFLSFTPMHDAAHTDANRMEESPFFQLESTQETPNFLKQELTPNNSEESAHCPGLRTYSGNKRSRLEFSDWQLTKAKTTSSLQRCTTTEGDSSFKVEELGDEFQDVVSSVDYTKLTVMKLRQELQEHGFGSELKKLKQPRKKDILSLYRTLMLKK